MSTLASDALKAHLELVSVVLLGARGLCACTTLGGETLPAQCGKQVLGTGDGVNVSVNMHDKFQQSLPICCGCAFIDRVVDIAGMLQRQIRTVSNCALGLVLDMPVIVHVKVVDITVVAQRPFPLVQFSRPLRFPSCSPLVRCSTSRLCRSSRFLGCGL